MKRLLLIFLAAVALVTPAAFAQEAVEAREAAASIGDATFLFTNEQTYFDVRYTYPDEFELEIREDGESVRHLLRYRMEGYDPTAVGIVISRTDRFTPQERLEDIASIGEVTTEEINGAPWAVGTSANPSKSMVIIYACAAGENTYTFSFSTDYPADFDFADFARTFVGEVTIQ